MALEFSKHFIRKNTQTSNLVKIRPVRAELFHADGRTERQTHDEANSRFSAILRTHLKTPCQISAYVAQIEFVNDLSN